MGFESLAVVQIAVAAALGSASFWFAEPVRFHLTAGVASGRAGYRSAGDGAGIYDSGVGAAIYVRDPGRFDFYAGTGGGMADVLGADRRDAWRIAVK